MLCSAHRLSRGLQHGSGVFPHTGLWWTDPGAAWFPKDFSFLLKQTSLSSSFALRKKTQPSSLPAYAFLKDNKDQRNALLPHTTEVYSNYLLHAEPQIGVIWVQEENTPGGAQTQGKPPLRRLCR